MSLWLGLLPGGDAPEVLAERALAAGCPLDVSSTPSLWGSFLAGKGAEISVFGGSEARFASSAGRAGRLVEAHLVGVLSSFHGDVLGTYFLCVDGLNDDQRAGATEALSRAVADGSVARAGVYSESGAGGDFVCGPMNPLYTITKRPQVACRTLNWAHGVAFCALPGPWRLRNLTLSFYGMSVVQALLARALSSGDVLVGVRTVGEIDEALDAQGKSPPDGLDAMLAEFAKAYGDDANWRELVDDEREWVREAAQRRTCHAG